VVVIFIIGKSSCIQTAGHPVGCFVILNENEAMNRQILIFGVHLSRSTRGKPGAPPALV
jgi:hypothetical protein